MAEDKYLDEFRKLVPKRSLAQFKKGYEVGKARQQKWVSKPAQAGYISELRADVDDAARILKSPSYAPDSDMEHKGYAVGIARNLLKDAISRASVREALLAAEVYEKVGAGSKPMVKKGLLEAARKEKQIHGKVYQQQEVEDFLTRNSSKPSIKLEKGKRVREEEKGLVGRLTALISIISLVLSVFFISSNLTGYTILNSQASSTYIGVILLAAGLIAFFIYLKKKQK